MKMNKSCKLVSVFSIFLLSILLVNIIPSISSGSEVINTFLNYEDAPEAISKTVTHGDSFNLVLVAYGHGEQLSYEQLELVSSTLIFKEYVAGDQILDYTYLYSKTYGLNTAILNPGTYTLRFTARTKVTQSEEYSDLQLTILPKIIPTVCGNNKIETGEQCDNGLSNGQPCNPLYGSSCTYCSASCKLITLNGPSCGDGTCNGPETCSTCSKDCGLCPDNIKPVVDIINPIATVYSSHRTSLTFSVYDDNLDSCTYRLNSGLPVNIASVSNGQNTVIGITSVLGVNTWTITCKDKSNNIGLDSVTFTVTIPPRCGDGVCNGAETCSTCSMDCGICPPRCGDGTCNGNENCSTCSMDCGICPPRCGDGVCNGAETCSTCSMDCGTCPDDIKPVVDIINPISTTYTSHRTSLVFTVYDDNLQLCRYRLNGGLPVNMASASNGQNTITGITSTLGLNTWIVTCRDKSGNTGEDSVTFTVTIPPTCGNGICGEGETCSNCSIDCGICPPKCGDGVCNSNENCSTCSMDCGTCPDDIKPVVDITNPTPGTYTSHKTILVFTVYDDNLDSCTYKLNAAPAAGVSSLVNGQNTITGITSIVGLNTWIVNCKDKSGNVGSDLVRFTVTSLPSCGDKVCNGNETCSNCPTDCGICPPKCGDGVCNGNETCSTCSKDCGICPPKNCTICEDSKPLDDSNYFPPKKIIIVSGDVTDSTSDKDEKLAIENKFPLLALALIIGVLILLIIIILIRIARR